jgi:hypothetical protein
MPLSTPPTSRATCSHCDKPRDPAASVRGSFCSTRCYYQHQGRQVLNQIASDHRRCGTCFRQVKEVERPRETDPDCVIGWQFGTEHATTGIDEFSDDEFRRLEGTRLSCECGAVDPGDEHDLIREADRTETVAALWRCLVELERDGSIQQRPDAGRFFDALQERPTDWAYAIGRALYD